MDTGLEAGFGNLGLGEADAVALVANGDGRIGRRCFVGNLAWTTSWQDLKDNFAGCGTVVYANVTRETSGRSKGWGIVEFETPEEAVTACQTMNGTELAGRNIIVREDREDRDLKGFQQGGEGGEGRPARRPRNNDNQGEGKCSGLQVVVQNLPWSYTWQELKALFANSGEVVRAEIMMDRNQRSKGYGTLAFLDAESAQNAINTLNGLDVKGRAITVKLDRFA